MSRFNKNPYPRQRMGENLTVCIFRIVFILFAKLACIAGSLWYLVNLWQYLLLGDARPYNVLSIETFNETHGTIAPHLNILSSEAGAINVTLISVHNRARHFYDLPVANYTNYTPLPQQPGMIAIGAVQNMNAKGLYFTQYVLKHKPEVASEWTMIGLRHPKSRTKVVDSREIANQHLFQPGHIVEIRYAPLEFHTVNRVTNETSTLDRFKYFLGFGGETVGYSYKSWVTHMPFPATRTPNTTDWDNLTTVIIIRPESIISNIMYNEEKTSIRQTLSDIGGLVGMIGTILVFLFGVSLMSPWGFIADIPFFRRKITFSLADAYTGAGGRSNGPFTTKVSDIGKFNPNLSTDERIEMVKEQLDELELVLRDYYVDGEVFQEFGEARRDVKRKKTETIKSHSSVLDGDRPIGGGGEDNGLGRGYSSRGQGVLMEPLTLPSRTLFESQHQHRGQLPSPDHPPVIVLPRRVRTASFSSSTPATGGGGEPSVFEYYQQQKIQQHKDQQQRRHQNNSSYLRNSSTTTLSEQPLLLHTLVEEDLSSSGRDRGSSRRRMGSSNRSSIQSNDKTHYGDFDDQDDDDDQKAQHMGLLQQDHHSMHQSYLQNTVTPTPSPPTSPPGPGRRPAYPARPPKDEIISMHLYNNDNNNVPDDRNYNDGGITTVDMSSISSPPPVFPTGFSNSQQQHEQQQHLQHQHYQQQQRQILEEMDLSNMPREF
ncbi:hypothetical protein BGX23_012069 [Mortierella sp. AD031]|nr:hypothetical protein BGX23_012069 [Mortierella sp. AD031]